MALSSLRGWWAAGVCLAAGQVHAAWTWNVHEMDDRHYVPAEQVGEFYKLVSPVAEGKAIRVGTEEKGFRVEVGSRDASVNGVRVALSFPVLDYQGKPMLSRKDLVKVVEPLLRPERIPYGRAFKTVIIDPGHGGHDRGAYSRWSTDEKKLTLEVAKRLRALLEAAGFKVEMTRERDVFVELENRPAVADGYENSIFVSLHFNSGPSAARGVETYALTPAGAPSSVDDKLRISDMQSFAGNANDANNVLMASAVQRRLTQLWGEGHLNRGVKRARFVVLYRSNRPAILVEGGFVSNSEDGKLISSPDFQLKLAEHIKLGILDYQSQLNEGVRYEPGMMLAISRDSAAAEVPAVETTPIMLKGSGLPITTVAIGTNLLDVAPFRPEF